MDKKNRNPWIAGILTLLTIGLGHLYSGHVRKGILLFVMGQGAMLAVGLPLIYYFPTILIFTIVLLIGFAFLLYCVFDAARRSKRHRYGYALKRYNKWYVYLGCWIAASFIIQPLVTSSIKFLVLQAYKIPAGSLKPTLLIGDHVLAKKRLAVKQGIRRGDLVIFAYPKDISKDFIKRVIATGGETIEIVNKEVFVNGELLQEPYVIHSDQRIMAEGSISRDNLGPLTVPADALFVMGDNRDHSHDSRYWGYVEQAAVKGIAYTIYWSWDKERNKVRWERIGKRIE